jgi:hypothetical protein
MSEHQLAPQDATTHHADRDQYSQVVRPDRDESRRRQRIRELACGWLLGHCWHPADAMICWFCCMCGGDVDGMPAHRCVRCREGSAR